MISVRLTGSVSAKGAPVNSAVVELHNSSDDVVDQVQVDDEGRYVYHLVPGSWVLRVWDNQGNRGSAEVTLVEGEDRVVDVEIGPA